MNRLTINREQRSPSLPTAVLWLALSVGLASVGQAEEVVQEITITAKPVVYTTAKDLRNDIQSTAQDAAWHTRVSVASKLSARLNGQRQAYRVASRDRGWLERG